MTEELIENPTTEVNPTTVETPATKTEKKFTQVEMDKIVQERISRERATSKKQVEEFTARETEYKTQLESYEKIMKGFIDEKLKEQSEPVKKLLSKLTISEQWEFLSSPENKVDKKNIPSTPKPSGESESKPRKKIGTII